MTINSEELKVIKKRETRERKSVSSQTDPSDFSGDYNPVTDQTAIAARQNLLITEISRQLNTINSQRNNAIEQISDILAYLHSPITFKNDVMIRTMEKLGGTIDIDSDETENNPFEALVDCFDMGGYKLPQVAVYSSMGSLPIC